MQIHKGRYYRNHWLQHVGNIIGERVYIADFAGISIVSRDHFMRWAKVEYTEEEVKTKFPKEYAEIEEVKATGRPAGRRSPNQAGVAEGPRLNSNIRLGRKL
jgi:hypothetical protein